MSTSFSLDGKNAIVTGGTRGIGWAIAKAYLEAGATVTICGRKPDGIAEAVEKLKSFHDRLSGAVAHVGKGKDREALVRTAEERFGPVNVLVNNAGTNPHFGPLIESDDLAFDKTMEVNLKGPYALSVLIGRKMVKQGGGAIINVASVSGLAASPNQGLYSISKAGLIMLTKVLASELGPKGVRVNCICPGLVRTKLSEALWTNPQLEQSIVAQKALRRSAEPDEIAGAAVYFASEAGSFTTGAVLPVDGGLLV